MPRPALTASTTTSTSTWLARATTRPVGAAHADVKLATVLDGLFGATRAALMSGVVDVDRAQVVVRAVEALPAEAVDAEPGLPARAEAHLLDWHRSTTRRSFGRWPGTCSRVLDPDMADGRLGRQLEAEEAWAARGHVPGDPRQRGRHLLRPFKVVTLHAAMLKKMVNAVLGRPARPQPSLIPAHTEGSAVTPMPAVTPSPVASRIARRSGRGHD